MTLKGYFYTPDFFENRISERQGSEGSLVVAKKHGAAHKQVTEKQGLMHY